MDKIFQAPAIITGIKTMADNTLRVQVDCQEMPPEIEAIVLGIRNKFGWFCFKENEEVKDGEIDFPDLPMPRTDSNKTPAQRLRSVLFVLWEKKGKKDLYGNLCDADTYYNQVMEHIINSYKKHLD